MLETTCDCQIKTNRCVSYTGIFWVETNALTDFIVAQVLFCQLTEEQRNLYKGYLASGDIKSIIDGRLQIFVGLTNLRKICNHPHLFASERGSEEVSDRIWPVIGVI